MRALVRGSDSWVLAAWHEMDVCRSGRPIRSSLRTLRTPSCWLLYSEWRSISRWSCHHVTSGVGSPKCVETGSSLVSHLIRSPHSIKVINQSLTSWKFHKKKKDPENDWKILKTSTKASNFFLKSWKFQNNNRKNGRKIPKPPKIPKIAKNPKILKSPSKSFQLRRLATLANHVNVLPFLSREFSKSWTAIFENRATWLTSGRKLLGRCSTDGRMPHGGFFETLPCSDWHPDSPSDGPQWQSCNSNVEKSAQSIRRPIIKTKQKSPPFPPAGE